MDRIDALRLFGRIAERGSFSAAARDLQIKQSTASKWIAELEAQLGTSLVDRTTRAIHITEAGRQLLARSQDVLAAFDEMIGTFEERKVEPSGRVRLSVPVVFGRLFVVPATVAFLKRYPQVHAELVLSDRYVNLVEEGFDLAVRVGIPEDTSALGRKLGESRRVLVASPAYLEARGRPRTPADLRKHECLIHGDGNAAKVWRFRRGSGPEVPVPARGRCSANNGEAVLQMVRAGLGIGLLADWLVNPDLKQGRLVPLLVDYSAPLAPIFALSPASRFKAITVRALTDHLAAELTPRLGGRPEPT